MFTKRTRVVGLSVALALCLSGSAWANFFHTAAAVDEAVVDATSVPQVGLLGVTFDMGTPNDTSDDVRAGSTFVLVGPNNGLLTEHQKRTLSGNVVKVEIFMGIDPVFGTPSHYREIDVDDWVAHEDALPQPLEGVDFSIIGWSDPITDITPAPLYEGPVTTGMEFFAAGFGKPGSVETGLLTADFKRRGGSNVINAITTDGYMHSRFDAMPDGGMATEWLATDSDSGGGWFVNTPEGLQLIGITSGILGGESYGSFSVGMPIGPHIEWIEDTMVTVPEPSAVAHWMLMMMMPVFPWRRRRRFPV